MFHTFFLEELRLTTPVNTRKSNTEMFFLGRSICAPASGACAGGGGGTLSEQNFQANARSALRRRVAGVKNPVDIFTFSFRTTWHDDPTVAATEVQYFTGDASFIDGYQKRCLRPTHVVSELFYDNGTEGTIRLRLSEEEVSVSPLMSLQSLTPVCSARKYVLVH